MSLKIEVNKAAEIINHQPVHTELECMQVSNALGRVLGEDIYARENVPPFDRSPFDGYAFRAEDIKDATKEKPVVLTIIEEILPGKMPANEIGSGLAAKILTGAPVPKGANAIIKYESTEFTVSQVKIFESIKPGTNIIPQGEDITIGDRIASKGTMISPPLMGMLASQGISEVMVYQEPTVTIISTGSELIEVDTEPVQGKIHNSNYNTLKGYLMECGLEVEDGGIIGDDLEETMQSIRTALQTSDMAITTGGSSVGDYDWVLEAVEKLGAEVLFRKVFMKPGGTMIAALLDGKMIFGLSGNPGAAVMGLQRIAMSYIKKLCGYANYELKMIDVVLKEDVVKESIPVRLIRGQLLIEDGVAYLTLRSCQGNGVISSFMGCNLIGEIPAGSGPISAGSKIKAFQI